MCPYAGLCARMSLACMLLLLGLPHFHVPGAASAFTIRIPPRAEECVYENARPGHSISIHFQVIDGGQQDVDIKFTFWGRDSPQGAPPQVVLMASRKTDEKYSFTAEKYGEYRFCFSNLMSLSSFKTINVVTSVSMPRENVKEEILDPLEEVILQLSSYVQVVKDEQTKFKQRDVITSNLADSTNNGVLWYSVMELMALLLAVAYQIYNIQSMFEGKGAMSR